MKISELIKKLQDIQLNDGDFEVMFLDYEYGETEINDIEITQLNTKTKVVVLKD
jgi:hypothetical protein